MTIERGQRVIIATTRTGQRAGQVVQIRPVEQGRAVVTVQTEPHGELVTVFDHQCQPAPQPTTIGRE